jgi:hypothetical protein
VSEVEELITSARRAAAVCSVTRFAVRAWFDRGLLPEPPWTVQQLRQVNDAAEPRPWPQAPHGTRARWSHGCGCPQWPASAKRHWTGIRASEGTGPAPGGGAAAAPGRRLRRQPFRTILRDLGLTPNQVWGLTKTDEQWTSALETALTAARRDDGDHCGIRPRLRVQRVSGPPAQADG